MKVNELLQGIEKSYRKYFTDSKIIISLDTRLYKSIYVKCLLAANQNEEINGYYENDMISISFIIDAEGKPLDKNINLDSEVPEGLQIKIVDNSYLIKPENQYLCYSSRKVSYRKTKGDSTKLLKTFDKWFKKLSEELKNDLDNNNIHENHIELLKSKLI